MGGFAFINFVDALSAEKFRDVFSGYTFQRHMKQGKVAKSAMVDAARVQGLDANLQHYREQNKDCLQSRHAQPWVSDVTSVKH